jgi:hypothetical protein
MNKSFNTKLHLMAEGACVVKFASKLTANYWPRSFPNHFLLSREVFDPPFTLLTLLLRSWRMARCMTRASAQRIRITPSLWFVISALYWIYEDLPCMLHDDIRAGSVGWSLPIIDIVTMLVQPLSSVDGSILCNRLQVFLCTTETGGLSWRGHVRDQTVWTYVCGAKTALKWNWNQFFRSRSQWSNKRA